MTSWVAAQELVVAGLIVMAAVGAGLFYVRFRGSRLAAERDSALVADLRREISNGKIPEARDRTKSVAGPLATVLLGLLRFPYGIHREAIERALGDGLINERRRYCGGSRLFLALAAVAAGVGATGVLERSGAFTDRFSVPFMAMLASLLMLGFWWRLSTRRRRDAARLESDARDIARLIVSFTESPAIVHGFSDPPAPAAEADHVMETSAAPGASPDA